MTGTIYGLCGPEGIRYVGQTRRKLSTRFQQHAQRARAGESDWHVYRWWRSLEGPPEIVVLETCAVESLHERERWWIAHLREQGVRLCNHSHGGEGGVPDARTRARLSARAQERSKDPDYLAKLRKANVVRWSDPAERARLSRSAKERYQDPAARQKMSEAITKRFSNQLERDRLRKLTTSSWARMTPEDRERRCQAMRDGWAKRRAKATA